MKDTIRKMLNKMNPAAATAKLGDMLDGLDKRKGVAVANIATPASATAEETATKVNALLTSLRNAGVIA